MASCNHSGTVGAATNCGCEVNHDFMEGNGTIQAPFKPKAMAIFQQAICRELTQQGQGETIGGFVTQINPNCTPKLSSPQHAANAIVGAQAALVGDEIAAVLVQAKNSQGRFGRMASPAQLAKAILCAVDIANSCNDVKGFIAQTDGRCCEPKVIAPRDAARLLVCNTPAFIQGYQKLVGLMVKAEDNQENCAAGILPVCELIAPNSGTNPVRANALTCTTDGQLYVPTAIDQLAAATPVALQPCTIPIRGLQGGNVVEFCLPDGGVSSEAGNVLRLGSDGKPRLTCSDIQACLPPMPIVPPEQPFTPQSNSIAITPNGPFGHAPSFEVKTSPWDYAAPINTVATKVYFDGTALVSEPNKSSDLFQTMRTDPEVALASSGDIFGAQTVSYTNNSPFTQKSLFRVEPGTVGGLLEAAANDSLRFDLEISVDGGPFVPMHSIEWDSKDSAGAQSRQTHALPAYSTVFTHPIGGTHTMSARVKGYVASASGTASMWYYGTQITVAIATP